MKVVSPAVTLDVDIERMIVRDKCLVLSGFSGVNEIETRISEEELVALLGLCLRGKVAWFILKSLMPWARNKQGGA